MGRNKDLAKNTAILSFGKLCTQGISFLLLPLYTSLLDTAEYGSYDLLITYGTLLLPILGMQMDQGVFRYLIDNRKSDKEKKVIFSTALISSTVLVLLGIGVLVGIGILFKISYTWFLCVNVFQSMIIALFLQFARGIGDNIAYSVASFITASGTVFLNVLLLVKLKLGLVGLLLSLTIAQFVTILYLIVRLKLPLQFDVLAFRKETAKKLYRYSIPLVPNQLSWWVVNVSDRTIISYVIGVAANGIYAIANKFSGFYISLFNIFNLAWTEAVVLHFNDEDGSEYISSTLNSMFKFFSSTVICIVAVMPFVFSVMINRKYEEAYNHIPILLYAMVFRMVVGLYSAIYIAMKETAEVAKTSFISAILNIVVNILLIKKIGLYAASISTLVAFLVMSIFRGIDVYQKARISLRRNDLIIASLMGIIVAVAYYVQNGVLNIIIFLATAFFFVWYNYSFLNEMKKMVVTRFNG